MLELLIKNKEHDNFIHNRNRKRHANNFNKVELHFLK